MSLDREVPDPRTFSLSATPFLRAVHRLHMTRRDGTPRAWALAAIAWVPLLVGALIGLAVGQSPPPILFDLSVHVRLLLGIPLLIQAERVLDERCRLAVSRFYEGEFAPRSSTDVILSRTEHARDSRIVELTLLVLVVAFGQAVLWGHLGPTGLFAGVSEGGSISFARIWYVAVSLPIVQFLTLRWLWHWVLWSYVVIRFSRLPLATIATHPDHAAGLGFLGGPLSGFTGFVLAISTTIAAAWGTQILAGRATLQAFVPSFLVFVVIALLVACGPLLAFTHTLYRARVRELGPYSGLALEYVRSFHHKWIQERTKSGELLGASDIQSLNDLGGAFQNLVQVRLVPFGPRAALAIWVAAVIPMLPLIATTMPLEELMAHIGRALLGGLPG